jgi:tRNA threonylcarbamoyladenosine biosynthesis protein TsaB
MALILNIDTSSETASICLSKETNILRFMSNEDQKDHAAWLHGSIEEMVYGAGFAMKDLQAIAITIGPGSYTGLRVGLAAAKGLCYALKIPLIADNTLHVMATAVVDETTNLSVPLICPMIDARRKEVFTAIYASNLEELMAPASMILDEVSFRDFLEQSSILFTGSGTIKWKQLVHSHNALFAPLPPLAPHLSRISQKKYTEQLFADLLYSEPLYLKGFHTHEKK